MSGVDGLLHRALGLAHASAARLGMAAGRAPAPGPDAAAGDDADTLVDVLRRHAQASASADPPALDRIRSHVLGSFAAAQSGRAAAPARSPVRVRAAVLLAVAVLLVVSGGALAASAPGGPLYATRIDIESLTLPNAGTPAWYRAEIGRLGDRVDEVQSAVRSDNPAAVEAAAGAYQSILAQTLDQPATSPGDIPPGLTRALDQHADLMQSLIPRAPAPAQAALRTALGHLKQAVAAVGQRNGSAGEGSGKGSGPAATAHPGRAGTPPAKGRSQASEPAGRSTQGGRSHGEPTPSPSPTARP